MAENEMKYTDNEFIMWLNDEGTMWVQREGLNLYIYYILESGRVIQTPIEFDNMLYLGNKLLDCYNERFKRAEELQTGSPDHLEVNIRR